MSYNVKTEASDDFPYENGTINNNNNGNSNNNIHGVDNFDQFVNFSPSSNATNLNSPIGLSQYLPSNAQNAFPNINQKLYGGQNVQQAQQPQQNYDTYPQQQQQPQSTSSSQQQLQTINTQTQASAPQQQSPVPGFKPDYNLQKANSHTDLTLNTQTTSSNDQQMDVSLFLDELNMLNSPSNVLSANNQLRNFGNFGDSSFQQQSNNSSHDSPIQLNTPNLQHVNSNGSQSQSNQSYTSPPPMIISTPPQDEASTRSRSQQQFQQQQYPQSSSSYIGQNASLEQQHFQFDSSSTNGNGANLQHQISNESSNLLVPDFSGSQFQGLRTSPSNGALSDLSSVGGSPYLSAYSPSHFGDDDVLSQHAGFLDTNNDFNDAASTSEIDLLSNQLNRLTEENLQTNNIINQPSPVTISIDAAPEEVSRKTPSLFSSNRSSPNNSPNHSRANSNSSQNMKSGHYANLLSPNDGSPSDLLKPEDQQHSNMRQGRQRRQSRSRSNSTSRGGGSIGASDRSRSLSQNREKMLELASPNQSNRRVQKHPSIYACHLCDKRFTRPYNLKSHLRTHTDERPFVCTVCGKAFARQHDRKRHEDLHSGKKRYECRGFLKDGKTSWGCGKKFARTDALGRHFKTEAGKECIRPLVEEHERDKARRIAEGGDGMGNKDGNLAVPKFELNDERNQFPEGIYQQFPALLYGRSPNHSGISDNGSDLE